MTVSYVNICLLCFVGIKTQTAALMFGWNEMHQTSLRPVSCGSVKTDWVFILKCEACQEMMPVAVNCCTSLVCYKVPCQNPNGRLSPTRRSLHTSKLGRWGFFFISLNSRAGNKQIKCKSKKTTTEEVRKRRMMWELDLWNFFQRWVYFCQTMF